MNRKIFSNKGKLSAFFSVSKFIIYCPFLLLFSHSVISDIPINYSVSLSSSGKIKGFEAKIQITEDAESRIITVTSTVTEDKDSDSEGNLPREFSASYTLEPIADNDRINGAFETHWLHPLPLENSNGAAASAISRRVAIDPFTQARLGIGISERSSLSALQEAQTPTVYAVMPVLESRNGSAQLPVYQVLGHSTEGSGGRVRLQADNERDRRHNIVMTMDYRSSGGTCYIEFISDNNRYASFFISEDSDASAQTEMESETESASDSEEESNPGEKESDDPRYVFKEPSQENPREYNQQMTELASRFSESLGFFHLPERPVNAESQLCEEVVERMAALLSESGGQVYVLFPSK